MCEALDGPITGLQLLRAATRVERGIATESDARLMRRAADVIATGVRRPETTPGVLRIAAERARQIDVEGYTPDHDAGHSSDELASAGACYALPLSHVDRCNAPEPNGPPEGWPFEASAWKPGRLQALPSGGTTVTVDGRIRELEKAGALIAASLDKLVALQREGGAA